MVRNLIYAAIILACILSSCTDAPSDKGWEEKKAKFTSKELEPIKALAEKVEFKFFITGEIPDVCKELETEIRDLMEEIQGHNPNITFSFIDPYKIKDELARAEFMKDLYVNKRIPFTTIMLNKNGVQSMKYVFTGGLISYKDAEFRFPLISVSDRPGDTELELSCKNGVNNAKRNVLFQIKKLLLGKTPRIAILTGHGEPTRDRTFIMEKAMTDSYFVERVRLKNEEGNVQVNSLAGYDGLLICNPRELFEDREKFVIDQFIMRGGKVIWMIDPVYVNEDSLVKNGQSFGLDYDLGLKEMLISYGVSLNSELVISENAAPLGIKAADNLVHPWYFYPILQPSAEYNSLNGVLNIKTEYVGTIEKADKMEKLEFTEVLKTDRNCRYLKAPVRINYGMIESKNIFQYPDPGSKAVGCLMVGKFDSHFKKMMPKDFLETDGIEFKSESNLTKMLVFADGSIVLNDTASVYNPETGRREIGHLKLDRDKYNVKNKDGSDKYRYGNLEFFMILLDEMMFGDFVP